MPKKTLQEKIKSTSSNAIGSAAGGLIGTAIAGPAGTIIGAATGALIATGVEEAYGIFLNNPKMKNPTCRFALRYTQEQIDNEEYQSDTKGQMQVNNHKHELTKTDEEILGYSITGSIAKTRLINTDTKKQKNLANILTYAEKDIREDNKSRDVSESWMDEISEAAEKANDEYAQKLWARVLSEEINEPGIMPKRLIHIISGMSQEEAEMFEKITACIIELLGEKHLYIAHTDANIYDDNGITFNLLSRLDHIGLIRNREYGLQKGINPPETKMPIEYRGRRMLVQYNGKDINLGKYMLTKEGTALLRICKKTKIIGFFEFIKKTMEDNGNIVAEIIQPIIYKVNPEYENRVIASIDGEYIITSKEYKDPDLR